MTKKLKLPIVFRNNKTTSHGVKKWDISKAKLLVKAVQHTHKLSRGFSIQKWAACFTGLRVLDKIKRSRISKVLSWYISNMNQKFIPEAFSAVSFRRKFLRIESAMKKQRKNNDDSHGGFLPLFCDQKNKASDSAVSIAEKLSIYYWPKGSCNSVLETVSTSLEEFHRFEMKFKRLCHTLEIQDIDLSRIERRQLSRFCEYLRETIPSSAHFIEQWLLTVNRQIQNWDDWEGDLYTMRFQIKSKRFQRMGYSWASDFCGSSDRWVLFMEELS